MKYGVCNWVFGEERLQTTAAFLRQVGFDGVELKGDLSLYRPDRVNAVLDDHGLEVLSLTPLDVDLAHPEPRLRKEAMDYYLRLVDFAAAVGSRLIACHGAVGRVRALVGHEAEMGHLLGGVSSVASRAAECGVRIAMELLNRYESHLLNNVQQGLEFVGEVGAPNVGLLLDVYHMNIEEPDPCSAVLDAGARLFLLHVADSNRKGLGNGHVDLGALMRALERAGYSGDVVIESTAAGPDPFTPRKGEGWREEARRYAEESLRLLKAYACLGEQGQSGHHSLLPQASRRTESAER